SGRPYTASPPLLISANKKASAVGGGQHERESGEETREPLVGFEPTTARLRIECSTPELQWQRMSRMPWRGFEPRRLSAPPPQDGVSTSFTTRALYYVYCVVGELRRTNSPTHQLTFQRGRRGSNPRPLE